MPLVEMVRTVVSADDPGVERAAAFAGEQLGKTVVHAKDRAGFIVNKLLCPYLFEAIRMLEEGFASREDIDAAMVGGVGYRMGPLALSDLIGNDTLLAVADAFSAEYQDSRYAAPPLLRRMVEAGCWGERAAAGFTNTNSSKARFARRSSLRPPYNVLRISYYHKDDLVGSAPDPGGGDSDRHRVFFGEPLGGPSVVIHEPLVFRHVGRHVITLGASSSIDASPSITTTAPPSPSPSRWKDTRRLAAIFAVLGVPARL